MIEEGHDATYDVMHPPSVAAGSDNNAREKPSKCGIAVSRSASNCCRSWTRL